MVDPLLDQVEQEESTASVLHSAEEESRRARAPLLLVCAEK